MSAIADTMHLLQTHGPSCGYFPEPSKSILICNPEDHLAAKSALQGFDFKYSDREWSVNWWLYWDL